MRSPALGRTDPRIRGARAVGENDPASCASRARSPWRDRLEQERFGIGFGPTAAVLLFIERVGYYAAAVTAPAGGGVTNDSEEPGTAGSASKRTEVSKRPQRRFLHDVLRILVIPHQPARQPVGASRWGRTTSSKLAPRACVATGCGNSSFIERSEDLPDSVWEKLGNKECNKIAQPDVRKSLPSRRLPCSQCGVRAKRRPPTAVAQDSYDAHTPRQ
jgi:hypothetical protein